MTYFAPIIIFGAAGAYLYALWREHRGVTTRIESLDAKICAVFFAYMGVAMLGFDFPVIERSPAVLGATPALLWASPFAAFPMAWAIKQGLQRVDYPNPLSMAVVLSIILPVFNLGWISLLNGALDFRTAQIHRVPLLEKRARHSSKGGWTYRFRVFDWANPGKRVQLQTKGRLYRGSTIGDTLELKVRRGAFGIEWLQNARNLSR